MPENQLTNAELLLLEQLWKLGEASPEDVQRALAVSGKEVTGGTVRKILLSLYNKDYAVRTKKSHRYMYSAREKPSITRVRLLKDLMSRAFDGSASLVVAALFKDSGVDDIDFEEIEKMVADYKKGIRK
jgi:predicted transcriptional regulator